jgi:hypothetical protein
VVPDGSQHARAVDHISLSLGNNQNSKFEVQFLLDLGAHACTPNTQEAEAGRLQVRGQFGLHSDSLCQEKKYDFYQKYITLTP